jgi:GNAT superfamily N-acetyltransferase
MFVTRKKIFGYLRAILDNGIFVYISELFVVPEMRNRKIGRALITKLKIDYSNLSVYALSDEDLYYEKLGYKKSGSVYKINQ